MLMSDSILPGMPSMVLYLMVVLLPMMLLMGLMLVLMGEVHLHVALMAAPTVHHAMLALLMGLVEHVEGSVRCTLGDW